MLSNPLPLLSHPLPLLSPPLPSSPTLSIAHAPLDVISSKKTLLPRDLPVISP